MTQEVVAVNLPLGSADAKQDMAMFPGT